MEFLHILIKMQAYQKKKNPIVECGAEIAVLNQL